jgi:hypothetical protein
MKPCGHAETVDRCWTCWRAANSRKWQAHWGLPVTAPETLPPLPEWVQGGAAHRSSTQRKVSERPGEKKPCGGCRQKSLEAAAVLEKIIADKKAAEAASQSSGPGS